MNKSPDNAPDHPWYRQPWLWFVIAIPAASVVAGLTMVGIAVVQQDSVVRDDWYKEGKAINQNMARDTRATTLGLGATIRMDEVTGEIRVRLAHTAAEFTPPAALTLYLSHPTQAAADQSVALTRRGDDYVGQLARGLSGRYYVELGSPEWRLMATRDFPQAEITLIHD